jgi:predicted DNA-binding ribbon-helix-helix protein
MLLSCDDAPMNKGNGMRTTLNLDPKLLGTAKRLAAARAVTLGDIISELANKGLEA